MTSVMTPDPDWVVPTTSTRVKDGVWALSPIQDMKPGEYGIFASGSGCELYDFGIDYPPGHKSRVFNPKTLEWENE